MPQTPLFSDVNNNGLVDMFGNGLTAGAREATFPVPAALAQQTQSSWYIAEFSQPVYLNSANYTVNNPSSYDPLYGNALYSWSEPGTNAAIAIYHNTAAAGGGYVYSLTGGNAVNEGDLFLSTPYALNAANNTLNHPITLSLDLKITQALFQASIANATSNYGAVAGGITLGFEINYDGAGGLPKFSGYFGMEAMTSYLLNAGKSYASYKDWSTTAPLPLNATIANQFDYGNIITGDPYLPLIPSDASAQPDLLTYTINNYAYRAIYDAFKNFSSTDQAYLFNMANWSVGGAFLGPATNNQEGSSGVAGNAELSVQLSNVNITTDLNQTYNLNNPTASVPIGDPNPQINFYDGSQGIGGKVDGAAYSATIGATAVQAKYIYNGIDNLSLVAPAGTNWLFGGGSGTDYLAAGSGDNVFQASTGSSWMVGGTGNDTFLVPDAVITGNSIWDTIQNFHAGDTLDLANAAGAGWSYSWIASSGAPGATGLTLDLHNSSTPGISELVTFASLPANALSGLSVQPGSGAQAGNLLIKDGAVMNYYDGTQGSGGTVAGAAPAGDVANIQASYLYTGSDSMIFVAPTGTNWMFGGGSGTTDLIATSGNNVLVASTGSSWMKGGSGDDIFKIPDANLTGIGTWDTIENFHTGDSTVLAGLAGAGWHYSWASDMGAAGSTGLTLFAESTTTPGLNELVTFAGLQNSDLAKLSITTGSGSEAGALIVTH